MDIFTSPTCSDSTSMATVSHGECASLEALTSLVALIELDELLVDKLSRSINNDERSDVVVLLPDIVNLYSSSLLNEAALEDTKAAHNTRGESALLKNPYDPFYTFVPRNLGRYLPHTHPSVYFQIEVRVMY